MKAEELRTAIIGSNPRPGRYHYLAAQMLEENGIEFVPVGITEGEVLGRKIMDIRQKPDLGDIHTITMYIGARRQEEYMDYLIGLHPQRIIFNPGAENPEFAAKALQHGIHVEEACTLVLLRTKQYGLS